MYKSIICTKSILVHLLHLSLVQAPMITSLIYRNNVLTNLSKTTLAPLWSLSIWLNFWKNIFELGAICLEHMLSFYCSFDKDLQGSVCPCPCLFLQLSVLSITYLLYSLPTHWTHITRRSFPCCSHCWEPFSSLFCPSLNATHPFMESFLPHFLSLSIRSDLWETLNSHTSSSTQLTAIAPYTMTRTCNKQMNLSLAWHLIEEGRHMLEIMYS